MKHFLTMLLILLGMNAYADVYTHDRTPVSFCKTGHKQSPVNITQVVSKQLPPFNLIYKPVEMYIFNDDVNTYVKPSNQLAMEMNGQRYELLDLHMHQPGEHTIDGHPFPVEIHYVHQAPDNHFIIIAQLIDIHTDRNEAFQQLLLHMSLAKDQVGKTQVQFGFDPSTLMSPVHDYYMYEGSRTTEPCSENATWIVLKNTLGATKAQIEALTDIIGYNTRIVQPIGDRVIYSSIP